MARRAARRPGGRAVRVRPRSRGLEEARIAALACRVEADVAAGRHAEVIGELRGLVAEHPTHEGFAAQLMLALYRCGRQAEALDAYQDARERLVGELGVEPGPELRDLQEAILRHDPRLTPQPAELPDELAAAARPAILGRTAELDWLLARWERAAGGRGELVLITGPPGIGRTRVAAELAEEVHRRGDIVLYASGAGPGGTLSRAIDRARVAERATLLVFDDVDAADADAMRGFDALAGALAHLPVLILAVAASTAAVDGARPDASIELGPIGVEAVRAIAAALVPGADADEIPAELLWAAAEGVPARVHRVAAEWARTEAERRVGALVGEAAAGRARLRSMEDELAGDVALLRRSVRGPAGTTGLVICPFKGLASFEAADADYFCGRERLVADLVAQLVGAPLLGVVGPSGSGKSSVVRAGLLPALASGTLPGSEDWPLLLMRPGEHPCDELERATAGVRGRFVLAVDQFEELFTACRDEPERSRFAARLSGLAQGGDGASVVVALRADFYGRCAAYPELARLLAANHVLVGAMRHVELRSAIVDPAERAGLVVEPELADALVADVEHQPGALPLLSTALLELWQRRDGTRLRLATYEETGGVLGAVARLAEDAFGRLDPAQQGVARTVLLRLAEVEPEGGVERRRLPLAELEATGDGAAAGVIEQLADARLLTVSAGSVEFAHEALLREWPRLRDWIEEDRDDLRLHRSLSLAEQEWTRLDRDDSALYHGARLAEAQAWAERGDPGPTEPERAFLAASTERERRERRSHRRRLAIAGAALATGVIAIAAIALVAMAQRRDAVQQRDVAVSRELAAESDQGDRRRSRARRQAGALGARHLPDGSGRRGAARGDGGVPPARRAAGGLPRGEHRRLQPGRPTAGDRRDRRPGTGVGCGEPARGRPPRRGTRRRARRALDLRWRPYRAGLRGRHRRHDRWHAGRAARAVPRERRRSFRTSRSALTTAASSRRSSDGTVRVIAADGGSPPCASTATRARCSESTSARTENES